MKIVRAMELITILNHCHRHRGFVYQRARFGPDQKSIEVKVRPREGSAAVCSGCHQPAPGYDHLPERCFEFIPLWGFLVFLLTVCGAWTAGRFVKRLFADSALVHSIADVERRYSA
jgi:hypothetical protein